MRVNRVVAQLLENEGLRPLDPGESEGESEDEEEDEEEGPAEEGDDDVFEE